jgi:hypothetical protein
MPCLHRVFNLEVEGEHNYLVGDAEIVTHNAYPEDFVAKPANRGKGTTWFANNGHDYVRVMRGDPDSEYINSRSTYVRVQKNGQALDVNGNVVPSNSPEAHIPVGEAASRLVWPF